MSIKKINANRVFCLLFLALLFFNTVYAALYKEEPARKPVLNDGKMHVYFCGTGDPEVTMQEVRKPSCLAVTANGQFLLFDAGEGTIQTLAALGLPYSDIHNIFMTHWHSDHFNGLASVINTSWYQGRSAPLHVYGPYGVKQVLNGLRKAYQLDVLFRAINSQGALDPQLAFAEPHQINAVKSDQVVFNKQGIKIIAFNVDHAPVYPALGYVIQYKNCRAVISGDTKVTDNLMKHAANSDVLINEALSHPLNQLELQKAEAGNNAENIFYAETVTDYHSDTLELAKMAEKVHVKKLILTHLVPAIAATAAAKKSFISGMGKYYKGSITVADDKDELILSPHDDGVCQVQYVPALQPDIKITTASNSSGSAAMAR